MGRFGQKSYLTPEKRFANHETDTKGDIVGGLYLTLLNHRISQEHRDPFMCGLTILF